MLAVVSLASTVLMQIVAFYNSNPLIIAPVFTIAGVICTMSIIHVVLYVKEMKAQIQFWLFVATGALSIALIVLFAVLGPGEMYTYEFAAPPMFIPYEDKV